ncbi:DUF1403 family protein [Agrobacterium vitis]|nr:DUF1403 family protein [Agrobacterium vitis]
MVARRSGTITTPFVKELAGLLGIAWHDSLASIPAIVDSANQSGQAAPFVAADLIAAICVACPDAEALALGLADLILAQKLNCRNPCRCCSPNGLARPSARSAAVEAAFDPGSRRIPKRSARRWPMASTPPFAPLLSFNRLCPVFSFRISPPDPV